MVNKNVVLRVAHQLRISKIVIKLRYEGGKDKKIVKILCFSS